LYYPGGDELLAASEQMLMNVESESARSAPFAEAVAGRVAGLLEAHRQLPLPVHVARVIGLPPAR
jgi:acyl-CoA thioester hydrolase